VAHIVSQVTNPAFVALPTFLAVALASAPSIASGLLWWLATTIGVSVSPLVHVYQGVRSGRYRDQHLSVRRERLLPFLIGLASTGATLAVLLWLHASRAYLATLSAVLIGVVVALLITHGARWKISLHVAGISGATAVVAMLFGWPALVLAPLVPLVGWARWRLGAHTPAQAIAAALIAVVVTVVTFLLLGVR
jgi:membrane-associated phospholipid phosphatase